MRVNIRSLMLAVAALAVALAIWKVRSPIAVLLFAPPVAAAIGTPILIRQGRMRTAGWGFAIAALAANLVYAAQAVVPDYSGKVAMLTLWLLLVLPICGALGLTWAILVARRGPVGRRAGPAPVVAVLVTTCLPLVATWTDWPFYVAFHQARPELGRIADLVLAGQSVSLPRWVGVFCVTWAGIDPFTGKATLQLRSYGSGAGSLVLSRPLAPGTSANPLENWRKPTIDLGGGWLYVDP